MQIYSQEAFNRIRRLHIKAKKIVDSLFAGVYRSAFKGRGIEFEDVREYQIGDDVRTIDWNVSARMGHPYIKTFREERELIVILMIDVSASSYFSSTHRLKSELMAELGALLTFSALQNQDRIGLILFSDEIELYIPPKRRLKDALRIIRELLFFKSRHKHTNIKQALVFLGKVQRKRAVCFLISDFLAQFDFAHEASLASLRHDLIFIGLNDLHEEKIPSIGLIHLYDLESGEERFIDSSDKETQAVLYRKAKDRQAYLQELTGRIKADYIQLYTNEPYLNRLHQFFKRRGNQR